MHNTRNKCDLFEPDYRVWIQSPRVLRKNKSEAILFKWLKQGIISPTEAQELRNLLEREKHVIDQQGNCLAFLAVTFLISHVYEYLEAKSNSLFTSEA